LAFAADPSVTKDFDGVDTRIADPFSRLTPYIQLFEKVPTGSTYNGWDRLTAFYKRERRIRLSDLNPGSTASFEVRSAMDGSCLKQYVGECRQA